MVVSLVSALLQLATVSSRHILLLLGQANIITLFNVSPLYLTQCLGLFLPSDIATVVGYLVVSRPFLNLADPRHMNSSQPELLEDYYQSGRMLLRMSQALGRIVLAGREMTRLSG